MLLALLLTACPGGDDDPPPTTAAPPTTAPPTTAAPIDGSAAVAAFFDGLASRDPLAGDDMLNATAPGSTARSYAVHQAAVRAVQNLGIDVMLIKDVTPIPHNGCRPPKARRV